MGIEEVFLFLSQQMVRVRDSREAGPAATGSLRRRNNIVVEDHAESEPAKRSCCG